MELESSESESGSDSPHLGEDSQPVSQFVENMGLHFEDYEVSRIGGRMIGLLLLASHPLTSEQMSVKLQVSRSSISTNLRVLLSRDLIEKVSIPGDRIDYYVIDPDFWKKIIQYRLSSLLEIKQAAEEGMQQLSKDEAAAEQMEKIIAELGIVEEVTDRLYSEWQSQGVPA